MKLGIISDTHDMLRPEVLSALKDADMILHAGDISSPKVLEQLQKIAPVYAVLGNADKEWPENLPVILDFTVGGLHVCMSHQKKDLPKDLSSFDLVITGHTHQYSEKRQGKILLINPGSCGPRRFYQKITMALAETEGNMIKVNKIGISHLSASSGVDSSDVRTQIEIVIREIEKGRGTNSIAEKYGIEPAVAELIARLYFTHPGVTADGIMRKMGL